MKKIILHALLCLFAVSCTQEDKKVYLSGELVNFSKEYFMKEDTPQGTLLKKGHTILLDENDKFEVSFELDVPSYYKLGRNTLYLSPGDHLHVKCDYKDPGNAEFSGSGEVACSYLKSRPFPKAGSYLEAGKMIKDKPSLEEVRMRVASEVERRNNILNNLEDISPRFRKLEEGRIMFDAANSLHNYPIYLAFQNKVPREELAAFSEDYNEFFNNDKKDYLADRGEALYLNLEVFRSICQLSIDLLGSDKFDRQVIDYLLTESLINALSNNGPVAEVLENRDNTIKEIELEDYKKIIESAFEEYESLLPGNIAPEIDLIRPDGTMANLSDFKNRVLVVDVWATWCGPCMIESPIFEELAEKYKGENIEFISLSIDSDEEAWQRNIESQHKFTQQFITNKANLSSWLLTGIPRFIILNDEGIIIDAFAPAPSDPGFEETIMKALNL